MWQEGSRIHFRTLIASSNTEVISGELTMKTFLNIIPHYLKPFDGAHAALVNSMCEYSIDPHTFFQEQKALYR